MNAKTEAWQEFRVVLTGLIAAVNHATIDTDAGFLEEELAVLDATRAHAAACVAEALAWGQRQDGALVFPIVIRGLPAAPKSSKDVAIDMCVLLEESLWKLYSPLCSVRIADDAEVKAEALADPLALLAADKLTTFGKPLQPLLPWVEGMPAKEPAMSDPVEGKEDEG